MYSVLSPLRLWGVSSMNVVAGGCHHQGRDSIRHVCRTRLGWFGDSVCRNRGGSFPEPNTHSRIDQPQAEGGIMVILRGRVGHTLGSVAGATAPSVTRRSQAVKLGTGVLRKTPTRSKVIKLHVGDGMVNTANGRGVAHGSLHPVLGR